MWRRLSSLRNYFLEQTRVSVPHYNLTISIHLCGLCVICGYSWMPSGDTGKVDAVGKKMGADKVALNDRIE